MMNEQEMQMKLVSQQEKIKALRQEIVEINEEREYWQQVHIQFVGQIASAIMSNYEFYAQGIAEECKRSEKSRPEMVAQISVEIADALVAELKKGGGMKPLSDEELNKCAEDAWQKTSFMAISHDAFIAAYKQGYAKCIWQMSDKFNELISVFEALYASQMKGGEE